MSRTCCRQKPAPFATVVALTWVIVDSWMCFAYEGDSTASGGGQDVLQTMIAERMRLKSGVFEVKGKKHFKTRTSDVEGDVAGFCAFDFPTGRYRFDNQEPHDVSLQEAPPVQKPRPGTEERLEPIPATEDRSIRVLQMKGVRTRESTIEWYRFAERTWNDVIIAPPGRQFQLRGLHHPFDVRAAGMMTLISFRNDMSFTDVMRGFPLEGVEREAVDESGSVVLAWTRKHARLRATVNVNEGATPIRLEVIHDRSATHAADGSPPVFAETQWKWLNDVWVPTFLKLVTRDDSRDDLRWYELNLDWKQVNQPVSDELFSYRSFEGVPKGTYVRDIRGPKKDEPTTVEIIGQPPPLVERIPDPPAPTRRWKSLIAINAVVLTLIAALVAWRRFHRPAGSP